MGQAWILVHRHAPSLVVGKVHVQRVELEKVHLVDAFLQFVYGPEVAATVEHQTTIAIQRLVLNIQYRKFAILGGKDELMKTGEGMADTFYIACVQLDTILGNGECISFFGKFCIFDQYNRCVFSSKSHVQTGRLLHIADEVFGSSFPCFRCLDAL